MNPAAWPAPQHPAPVVATVAVPGSKSLSNRYLVLAALATGPSVLDGLLHSRDTALMIGALRALGARIETDDSGRVRVEPIRPLDSAGEPVHVECGLAGTVMRFVPPLAAVLGIPAVFDGDPAARTRPMDTVADALRQLGCAVTGDALPLEVIPPDTAESTAAPVHVRIDASASSQFVSGLLLAGGALPTGLIIEHTGATVPSRPHIDMTVEVLRAAGVAVTEPLDHTWHVAPGRPRGLQVTVEPDLSNAATFLAAALITSGTVTVPAWPDHTTQAGDAIRSIAEAFGGSWELTPAGLSVMGPDRLRPVDLDLSAVGELTPVVAAVAAQVEGTSRLTGIGHLRGHETDRLAALARELTKTGVDVVEQPAGLTITGPPSHGTRWDTYADHRMVMAGALLALLVPETVIADPGTVAKTLPEFTELWSAMVGR
ncbi:3-phosphoshikimate 1-carboxyvinyltransferase [Brevibacterium sp. 50QC2O2]|uniref:3-phosphoshikimate 1-carboxyvinyltransferase n=1 Tax=Brevibacterium sp. 50QC2O2 TaxID=2968459 RepID=UPI00211D09DD|nr:3-phosphoshikimate 1-carboxyvinyltransferase [Brevibacterium sp. 50QC2O2]MCQ9387539.1 3-phosphoshikimate 1-carboxyvinyltransferase [Brevibacterium sp. 50QC2O2]